MKFIKNHNNIWLALGALAPLGLYLLYDLIGVGIKKDILGLMMAAGCLLMWRLTKSKWWVLICQAILAVMVHFFSMDWTGLTLSAAAIGLLIPVSIKNDRWYGAKLAGMTLIFAFINLLLVQDAVTLLHDLGELPAQRFLLNLVFYLAGYFVLYALCGSWKASVITVLLITVISAALNLQIYFFRGSELKMVDLLSIGTAVQVAKDYKPQITMAVIRNFLHTGLLCLYIGTRIKLEKPKTPWFRRTAAAAACGCVLLLGSSRPLLSSDNYQLCGSMYNGFCLNITLNTITLEKPEGYDSFDFSEIEQEYLADTSNVLPEDAPNIVVVMNESFADLRTLGKKFQTDVPVYAYYDSLTENIRKGYALASVLGGNTANSEYEMLTGNSMAFLPDGVVSYMQYIYDGIFSFPAYLRELGYDTVALHPHQAQNWARIRVWEQLGFETRLYIDDFPKEKMLRKYVSDEEVYDQVIDILQTRSGEKPAFVFALTVHNHGGYTYEGYESTVKLEGLSGDYPDVEQYLSLIRESDRALERLITGLQELEEDTIVLFFGDHFPRLPEEFRTEVFGHFDSLDRRQKIYEVPCFLWANYDIPEDPMALTSLNYLGIDVLELAGIPLPPYAAFLQEVRQAVPALNPYGYYSLAQDGYVDWNQPPQGPDTILDAYRILTYNSIKGGKNRSSIFSLSPS